jgi:putative ABC transport system permease protein
MFDLEKAIAAWRRSLEYSSALLREDVDELESHVRDQVRGLVLRGLSEEEAFNRAIRQMGAYGTVEGEYQKVYWGKVRRRHEFVNELTWRASMFKNYLKIAFRNLLRRKVYTFINVVGLAVGLACCLLIALYLYHEWSYDRFHEKGDRIYRVVSDLQTPGERLLALSTGALAPALKADFPEVLRTVRFAPVQFLLSYEERRFHEQGLLYADSSVFQVFDFVWQSGNSATALVAPYQIVLTRSMADKYFEGSDPIGQVLIADGEHTLTVTGIIEDVPSNSHLQFDGLISMATYEAREAWRFQTFRDGNNISTYLLLAEGYDPALLQAKMPAFVERHTQGLLGENTLAYVLEPLTKIYFNPPRMGEPRPAGNVSYLYIFSIVAGMILVTACINFMNLTTARSAERAKEVGVRKVVGAQRQGIAVQFLTESLLLACVAMVLAFVLAAAALPLFRSLSGKALGSSFLVEPPVLAALIGMAICAGLLAGSYPSIVLSGFRPVTVLKGAFAISSSSVMLRKGLVVFQFGISVALIIGTAVVFSQVDYLRSMSPGFRTEQMLVVDFHGDRQVSEQAETIKQALLAQPGVLSVTASSYVPGRMYNTAGRQMQTASGERRNVHLKLYEADYDFLSAYDIEILAGRNFSLDIASDSTQALIVNEAAARHLGFTVLADAVGAEWGWGAEEANGRIIGVVENFNFQSLHTEVEPLSIQFLRWEPRYLTVRMQADRIMETLAAVEQEWQRLVPHRPLEYRFLDEVFDAQYQADVRFGRLFSVFAGLAIFIACLGLFGLAAFTAQQRTKEIGVRKVLGASVPSIIRLLSADFLKLVGIAFVVAMPLAYFGMQRWLEDFAYRIDIGPGIFLFTGFLVLLIALLTVSYQSIKAALADPVKSLRYE